MKSRRLKEGSGGAQAGCRGRRWLAGILLALVAWLALTASPALLPGGPPRAAAAPGLPDLQGHWSEPAVRRLVDRQLIQGRPDGRFYPDEPLTRAEFFALVVRTLAALESGAAGGQAAPAVATGPATTGPAAPAAATRPAGVPAQHWALPALDALLARGLIRADDYLAGLQLDQPIPRREMARLVVRAMGLEAEARSGQGVNRALADLAGEPEARTITTAVAHGYLTGYPDGRFGPGEGLTRAQGAVVILRMLEPGERVALWQERYRYEVGGRELWLQVVRVNLRRPDLRPQVVTAAGGTGSTQDPLAMAQAAGALAAINGTYLNAYAREGPRDPYGTVIQDGRAIHLGADRAAIGFWPDGRVRVGPIGPQIVGGSGGWWNWPHNWYAYGLNHTGTEWGENWVVVHTPDRGADLGYDAGTSVVVENGVIRRIAAGNVSIPRNGFVVNLGGSEATAFLERFRVGDPLEYRVELGPEWEGVSQLLQAGPQLVAAGRVAVNLEQEKFLEDKITTLAWNRSAVGVTRDGILILATTGPVRVQDLAPIMADLGAWDALCMDSGASSALVYQGQYLTPAGREISNILAIVGTPVPGTE